MEYETEERGVARAIAQDPEETEVPQFDRVKLEKAVAESPMAQFILDYLRKQEGPVDYADVMLACSEKGIYPILAGIWTGRLMALGLVDDLEDPTDEYRALVVLHQETTANGEKVVV